MANEERKEAQTIIPAPIVVPQKPKKVVHDEHYTADLFQVSDEDVLGEGGQEALLGTVEVTDEELDGSLGEVFEVPEEEDMSDLVEVSNEDIYGGFVYKRTQPTQRYKRTSKTYTPPETSMGTMG